MSRDEARHRSNFCEESNFVDLSDNSIQDFPFKGLENNGLVLNWIKDKASAWLDDTNIDIVDGGDSNYKAILAGAGPIHLGEELLLHHFEQVRAEVVQVQQDLVLQGDVIGQPPKPKQPLPQLSSAVLLYFILFLIHCSLVK